MPVQSVLAPFLLIMTEYEKEVYLEYLKSIHVDIKIDRDRETGKYIKPKPIPVFNVDGKGK
ncbi:unnamed protein product [marine sediment metagenome]|uniref:Uncharacterized protein n=1 Tax=marine sediment metagenome TaxID=412755 RepID=X0WA93_9ZZZZ